MERHNGTHYEINIYTNTNGQQLTDRRTATNKRDALRIAKEQAGLFPFVEVLRQYTYNGDYVAFDVVAEYLNGKLSNN